VGTSHSFIITDRKLDFKPGKKIRIHRLIIATKAPGHKGTQRKIFYKKNLGVFVSWWQIFLLVPALRVV
jgi:hypothetical protein